MPGDWTVSTGTLVVSGDWTVSTWPWKERDMEGRQLKVGESIFHHDQWVAS